MAEKAYEKVINYIKQGIVDGKYSMGEKLPPERELAEQLEVSRNSVREGLKILGIMGVISSQQGAGNYISDSFEKNLVETLSMMYALRKIDYPQITEFRYALEIQAFILAMDNISQKDINEMKSLIEKMESDISDAEKAQYDKKLHYTIISASKNWLIMKNLMALNEVIDIFIFHMRQAIISNERGGELLKDSHRQLVEALDERNLNKGLHALDNHFTYIRENIN